MPSMQIGSPGAPFPAMVVEEKAASYVATELDFKGGVLLSMNVGSANTLTINTGLKASRPLSVVNQGLGLCTITAGASVTINSPGGLYRLTEQFSMCTLIPDPDRTDTFWLVGALS